MIMMIILIVSLVVAADVPVWLLLVSNRWGAAHLGDIPLLKGFVRQPAPEGSYAHFLRQLPIKKRGAWVRLYRGRPDRHLRLSAGVIDKNLLSNSEQCANVPMRLLAEYLWSKGRYQEIVFHDNPGNELRYQGADKKEDLEDYLRQVFDWCNTSSLVNETIPCDLSQVQPGDVFVYTAGSRPGQRYGHAMMVADVAHDDKGRTALMLIEGNTPARHIHIVRQRNPLRNPWIVIDSNTQKLQFPYCYFTRDELRRYSQAQ